MKRERPVRPLSIALCADDYGQHGGIDDAVCAMLDAGRLSAVSCMTSAPRWQAEAAPALRAALARAAQRPADARAPDAAITLNELARRDAGLPDVGLHLNLTEGFGQPAPGLPEILLRSYLRRLDRRWLAAQFDAQFDAFEQTFGRMPDFIDGHQHIHQLPVVREVLLSLLARRYPQGRPWLRNTVPADPRWRGKPRLLARLGGSTLAARLKADALPTNYGFAGVYDFRDTDYPVLFGGWLDRAVDGTLLMCHPGARAGAGDPIGAARVREYAFFSSEQFPAMLAAYHIRLERLSQLLPRIAAALAVLPASMRDPRFLQRPPGAPQ